MSKTPIRALAIAALTGTLFTLAMPCAHAQETPWEKKHPRRDQINDRLHNQNKRISQEVKEGEISTQRAQQLRAKDKSIRHEERVMAAEHDGHITKAEQAALNRQLDRNSAAIGK
jgi:hypothetical protein